ncbi:hypothetical protein JQ621_26620 [Bradyrhizobium manausense]|uniref:outer membrane protein n=1 Tax=Bradyrhizobium manausense TaxID=989370 RepID=UPI001BAD7397|nr:hypothetical protein [Bradyrhizobium manausense]MBR1091048.1 hypothetical protein [Bradyrhizobium manausense]
MRKFVLCLTAVAAMTGSASAADLATLKAPVAAVPVASWTGCYVGAGGGGAYTANDHDDRSASTPFFDRNETASGRGWFGTIQGGCDYQFSNWVVGGFADYDVMDVTSDLGFDGSFQFARRVGSQKQDRQWAVGARAGYVVLPQLLTYVSAGYTQAHWQSTDLAPGFIPLNLPGATLGGWFIGAGDEYALGLLPGLFWKTEYRYSEFDRTTVPVAYTPFAAPPTAILTTEKFREHSVRSELVYRFNWGGSATAAADPASKLYTKAPVAAAPAANWTGCYVGAGGGAAYTANDHNEYVTATGLAASGNESAGAYGWFGTVQAGCDYQFSKWLVGAFGDYDFMDVKGDIGFNGAGGRTAGSQKQDGQWAVGARAGYAMLPQLLTYVSAGYTQAHWQSADLFVPTLATPSVNMPGTTKGGWFIGAGDEYALGFLRGLFWKTEYRYSEFDRANVPVSFTPGLGGGPTGFSVTEKFREHNVRSELVYRFNWAGPVTAKY